MGRGRGISPETRPDCAERLLNWWGLATYAVGGVGLFWSVLFALVGVVAVFGNDAAGGTSSVPLAGAFASALGAAVGVILLVTTVPLLVVAVLVLSSGRGARRRSRRWWLVGMALYALGGLLALASGSLGGVGVFGGLLVLGVAGRTALD